MVDSPFQDITAPEDTSTTSPSSQLKVTSPPENTSTASPTSPGNVSTTCNTLRPQFQATSTTGKSLKAFTLGQNVHM